MVSSAIARLRPEPFGRPKAIQEIAIKTARNFGGGTSPINVLDICESGNIRVEHWAMVNGVAIFNHKAVFVLHNNREEIILSPHFQTKSEQNYYLARILAHRILHLQNLDSLDPPQVLYACSIGEECESEAMLFAGWVLLTPTLGNALRKDAHSRFVLWGATPDSISAQFQIPSRLITQFAAGHHIDVRHPK